MASTVTSTQKPVLRVQIDSEERPLELGGAPESASDGELARLTAGLRALDDKRRSLTASYEQQMKAMSAEDREAEQRLNLAADAKLMTALRQLTQKRNAIVAWLLPQRDPAPSSPDPGVKKPFEFSASSVESSASGKPPALPVPARSAPLVVDDSYQLLEEEANAAELEQLKKKRIDTIASIQKIEKLAAELPAELNGIRGDIKSAQKQLAMQEEMLKQIQDASSDENGEIVQPVMSADDCTSAIRGAKRELAKLETRLKIRQRKETEYPKQLSNERVILEETEAQIVGFAKPKLEIEMWKIEQETAECINTHKMQLQQDLDAFRIQQSERQEKLRAAYQGSLRELDEAQAKLERDIILLQQSQSQPRSFTHLTIASYHELNSVQKVAISVTRTKRVETILQREGISRAKMGELYHFIAQKEGIPADKINGYLFLFLGDHIPQVQAFFEKNPKE